MIERLLNVAGLVAIAGILIAASVLQYMWHELPCPLCLLQRVGFVVVGFALMLNVRFGPRPSHYGLLLIAALFGLAISGRQVLLHIVPGTGHYGSAVFGLHFYTWAALAFLAVILGTALMLLFVHRPDYQNKPLPVPVNWLAGGAMLLIMAVTLFNAGNALVECGLGECADNPVRYRLLEGDA